MLLVYINALNYRIHNVDRFIYRFHTYTLIYLAMSSMYSVQNTYTAYLTTITGAGMHLRHTNGSVVEPIQTNDTQKNFGHIIARNRENLRFVPKKKM